MAKTPKPAKGASKSADKSAEKPIEDAVVLDEKSAKAGNPAEASKAAPNKPVKASDAADKVASDKSKIEGGAGKSASAKSTANADAVSKKETKSVQPAATSTDKTASEVSTKAEVKAPAKSDVNAKDAKSAAKPAEDKPASDKKAAAEKSTSIPKSGGSKSEPAKPEPAKAAVAKPAATPAPTPAKRGGFMPMLLGGAIAAALGFGAARYPDQWPFVTGPVEDPMATMLAKQGEQLAALEANGESQAAAVAALQSDDSLNVARGEISGEFAQLRTQLEAMSGKLDDLENRLHTVEKLPQGSGMEAAAAAASAYERELQQMRQMLDAELAKITTAKDDAATLEQSAAEAAKAAGARAALARVLAALDTGRPYGDALFDLTQQAGVDAPAALSEHAEAGVPTLVALQSSFPEAARAALDASVRAAVAAGEIDRVSAFFRLQLGTRSLSPKEGADPDAVLSRAEAALKSGQLDAALNELATMPEAGQPALGNWIALATSRKDALAAGDALAQLVNSK